MRFKFILIAVAAMAVVACTSSSEVRRQQYLNADYYTRLELPPNLTKPSSSQELSVPKPTDKEMQKFKDETKDIGKPGYKGSSVEEILPTLTGVTLKTEAGMSWLEVDSNPQQLWPKLKAFLNEEGIPIVKSEPMIGIIETDWVSKLRVKPNESWLKKVFNKSEPEYLDKFRLRIASDGTDKTRVYIAHIGKQEIELDNQDYPSWRARCSDPGLEQELLSRLALYLGLDPKTAKLALAKYGPYASRVISVVDFNPDDHGPGKIDPNIYLNETLDGAWLRTQHALDRLDAQIIKTDPDTHEYDVSIKKLKLPEVPEDDLQKSDKLMHWLESLSQGSDKSSKYRILLSDEGQHKVKLHVEQLNGQPIYDAQAGEFLRRLAKELQ